MNGAVCSPQHRWQLALSPLRLRERRPRPRINTAPRVEISERCNAAARARELDLLKPLDPEMDG